jgi:hypothetical protein
MIMAYRNDSSVDHHGMSITAEAKPKRPHDSTMIAARVVIAARNRATLMEDADPWKGATVEDVAGDAVGVRFPVAMGVVTVGADVMTR